MKLPEDSHPGYDDLLARAPSSSVSRSPSSRPTPTWPPASSWWTRPTSCMRCGTAACAVIRRHRRRGRQNARYIAGGRRQPCDSSNQVTVRPPRRQPRRAARRATRWSPAVFRVTASRARLRHPRPAAVGDLDPDGVVRCLDRDRVRERALAECLAEGRGRLAARPLALLVRAEPVEDQPEHGLRSVFRSGCRPPQGAGELQEVTGVGVRADGAVAFARVE